MSPKKKVPTLVTLSREKVLFDICAIVLHEIYFPTDDEWEQSSIPYMTPRLQSVKDILYNTLGPIEMQDILNLILSRDEALEPAVRYLSLQLLLTESAKILAVGHFPESYYSIVLETVAENAKNLEQLDLKGLWVREEDKFYLFRALRRLQHVKHLILRYVCDDEILGIVGKYCWNLNRLDISGSGRITTDGILNLISCPLRGVGELGNDRFLSLQIVDIGGPGAQHLPLEVVSNLLVGLPNLISLGTFERTGLAIKKTFDSYSNRIFKLKYLHDIGTRSDTMSTIINMCPDLQAIYLDSPGEMAVQHLHMLKQMTELKLNRCKWGNLQILLEKCGDRLRNLFLLTIWGQMDFLQLGILCPSLVRLELHSISLICSDVCHDVAFKKVKHMLIYNSKVTNTCAKFILNQSISMENLSLGECNELTDAALMSGIMDNALKNLKTLWFGLARNVTLRTVMNLIENCPELTNLGNLSNWDVPEVVIDALKVQSIVSNTNITLHNIGPEEEEGDFIMVVPP